MQDVEERRYALDQKVAHVEQNQAVLEVKLSEVKSIVERLELNYTAHVSHDDKELDQVRSQLTTLDRDVVLQRAEISFIKTTMSLIQSSIHELKSTVLEVNKAVNALDKKMVRMTGMISAGIGILMLIKDPILKALGLG